MVEILANPRLGLGQHDIILIIDHRVRMTVARHFLRYAKHSKIFLLS